MTKLVLIRHAHYDSDVPDGGLTERGIQQAESLANRLQTDHRPDAIFCSPVLRAFQTATIIADGLGGNMPVTQDATFDEMHSTTHVSAVLAAIHA